MDALLAALVCAAQNPVWTFTFGLSLGISIGKTYDMMWERALYRGATRR